MLEAAPHAVDTYQHEGDGKELAHVEQHTLFKGFLNVFGKLDKEAEGEDECETQTEEESRSYTRFILLIAMPAYKEEQAVGYGLVKLSRVSWQLVYPFEDKGPRHIGYLTHNFRVHEVSQADEACRYGGCYGNVVEHLPQV